MTSLRNQIPPRIPDGPIDAPKLRHYMEQWQRYVLARFDLRNDRSDFANGIKAANGAVTLGNQAFPVGRAASVPTLVTKINDSGRALNQSFLYPVVVGNRNSVQSINGVLTSTGTISTATINILSHSVKYDFGSVAYNSGSISGLNQNDSYLVYADDPNFAGGAVSYIATQDPNDVIASGRYYVGNIVTTVSSSSATITAATSANPIAFTTSAAHGWVTGDSVQFAGLPGDFGTNLNGNTYVITVTGASTFTIVKDGTAYTAYTSGGTATRVTTTAGGAGSGAGGAGGQYRWSGFNR